MIVGMAERGRIWGHGPEHCWIQVEGRRSTDSMGLPVARALISIQMRGVGGMHPSFAPPPQNEITVAVHEDMEHSGVSRSGIAGGACPSTTRKGKDKALKPFLF